MHRVNNAGGDFGLRRMKHRGILGMIRNQLRE
jgi:hypothetical protein